MSECNYDWKEDPLMPKPEILVAPPPRKEIKPTDVTDFPAQKVVEMPEEFHYPEGKYRPPSLPFRQGYLPFNIYLEKEKIYRWCSCGASWSEPFCDHTYHYQLMRNRPIVFNVEKSGYYQLCNCKQSANAPFCNGTHRIIARNFSKSHYGFYRAVTGASLVLLVAGVAWNFRS